MTAPATIAFQQLPIDGDQGFPQTFRMIIGSVGYVIAIRVDVAEEVLPRNPSGAPLTDEQLSVVFDLPMPGAFVVLTVTREDPAGSAVLLCRKLVPGLIYRAGELLLTVRSMRVALRNLGGVGSFGSAIVAGVAQR
jgi:hypothetical protein